MMHAPTELSTHFESKARVILAKYPEIRHEWRAPERPAILHLKFPRVTDSGFDIDVQVFPVQIFVYAGGAETQLSITRERPAEVIVQEALGLVRDLLSPAMRLRVWFASGQPYKWATEYEASGRWRRDSQVSLLFYNYFGKRTVWVHQNTVLPARTQEGLRLESPTG